MKPRTKPASRAHAYLLVLVLVYCAQESAQGSGTPTYSPVSFISEHSISVSGQELEYVATAGETLLKNDANEPVAAIWSTSYAVKSPDRKDRPVTFVFNGGPGSASAWLQMGLLGPKIVRIPGSPDSDDGAAPYALIDNPNSILDLTDLVFVDPVGTGYSRAVGSAKDVNFWSMYDDTLSMADFIHEWITANHRWNSPKYLLGLSYGSIRAVSLAHQLLNSPHDMSVNGLVLLGPALDLIGIDPIKGNPISHASYLPSMAAVAHYHQKAGAGISLREFVEEARQFSVSEYIPALIRGERLSIETKRNLAERYSYFTGLDPEYVLRSGLRVTIPRFRKELLRNQGLTVGSSDGRYVGREYDQAASDPLVGDPSAYKESSAYTAATNHYIATDLGVRMNRRYYLWNASVGRDWDWRPDLRDSPNAQHYRIAKRVRHIEVATKLASVMRRNEMMRVFVGVGYYDLITPFFDSERVFANFGIVPERIEMKHYESGHRIWTRDASRIALAKDLRDVFE